MENAPTLDSRLQIVWDAFQDLHLGRPAGMGGPEPLRESEILAWLELRGIREVEDRIAIRDGVRAMDHAWLKLRSEEDANT